MIHFIKTIFIALCIFQLVFVASFASSKAASEEGDNGFQVKIFDVGQGNCVAVKYNGKSILIDCGSRSLGYTAQYANVAESKSTTTHLSGKSATAKEDSDEKKMAEEKLSKQMGKLSTSSPAGSKKAIKAIGITPERQAAREEISSSEDSGSDADKDEVRSAYKNRIIEEIRDFLKDTRLSVIITHADEDHYNLIPEVTAGNAVENILISGNMEDYLKTRKPSLDTFKEWIRSHTAKILSTPGFYFSDKTHKDATESTIETTTTFSSISGDIAPQIKILAMNASAGGKRDTNADTIVLKIAYNGQSILLPGDATDTTWGAITGDLKSDYFLVSHHGAATHSSTSPEILERIEPEAVFVSAGRYKGTYCHPDRSVIDMLLATSSLEEDQDLQTFVTYFSDKRHRRLETRSLLFTTLNNGTITIDLGRSTAHTARAKSSTRYNFGTRSFTADKSFAFKEDSISDPGNPARFFSTLTKGVLGLNKVCFFRKPEGKAGGIATLVIDETKTHHSAVTTGICEHAFLIKQKLPLNEEMVIYLQDMAAASSETTEENSSMKKAAGGGDIHKTTSSKKK